MEEECSICCENYNKSTRKAITCQACDYSSCKSCIRKYLLDINNEPNCPSCHNVWTQEFIITNCNRSWYSKEHKEHRSKILVDYEMSQLPDTMVAADNYKFKEDLEERNKDINTEIRELRALIYNLQEEKNDNIITIREIKESNYKRGETKKFIMACPGEDCRGFLSETYKCDLCHQSTCPDCNEIMEEGHTCNEEAVQSAELIKKETKPCPKCGIRIFKINGCDQMWCTECHVAFSWKTGRFENGVVHNPHFYQWQRNNNNGVAPRVAGDNPCENLPDWRFGERLRRNIVAPEMNFLFENKGKHTNETTKRIIKTIYENLLMEECSFNENYTHNKSSIVKTFDGKYMWCYSQRIKTILFDCIACILTDIRNLNWDKIHLERTIRKLEDNTELRIQYLLKRISKKELTKQIIKRDIDYKRKINIMNIYDLIIMTSIETFNTIDKMTVDLKNQDSCRQYILDILDKINSLLYVKDYCNEQLKIISVTHNMTVPYFDKLLFKYSNKYTFKEAKQAHQPVITPQIHFSEVYTFTVQHLFSEFDFPTAKEAIKLYRSSITIPFNFTKKDLHNYLMCKYMGVYEVPGVYIKNNNKVKRPKQVDKLILNWPSTLPFTIAAELSHGNKEYLCLNHNNEYIKDREFYTSAVDWLKYKNEIMICWNGSRVAIDELHKNLEDFE